jgi:bile acid-coenzyme A ligase
LPDAELGAIVQLADPKFVVGADPARLPGRRVLPAGASVDPTTSAEPLPTAVSPHWKAMTSGGSTGRPKIIVDHRAGVYDPQAPVMLQQVNDVLLNPGPLYHNGPFVFMMTGLFTGAHVVEMGRFNAAEALKLIAQHRVQWVNLVPTMMTRIWKLPEAERLAADVSSLRVVFHTASACPIWLKEAWIDWLGPDRIFEAYGGTERQGSTLISGREWLGHKGSVGKVAGGARMRLLNASGEECAPDEIGEVYFLPEGGRNSTYHYIGSEAKADGEWESLGDLGRIDADGYLYLVDRRTDLILSGGANIYPAEIEAALDAHDEVLSSAVVGLPDEDLGQRAHAIVQRRPGSKLSSDSLLAYLGQYLARYKVPRSLEFIDSPLRDEAGKVRRAALRDERVMMA